MPRSAGMASQFGQTLKELRTRAGLTQEQLARVANLSLSAVTKLEAGKVDPTWGTVQRIAKALGVSVAEFEDTSEQEDSDSQEKPPSEKAPKKKGGE